MKEQNNTPTMKVYTIKIQNEITGRFDFIECPTKQLRAKIAGDYINTLSKYPDFIHCNTFESSAIVTMGSGKRVVFKFDERDAQ